MPKDKPVHEERLGSIKAAIWKNKTANGTRFNVTFSRVYREDNEWRSSDSFGRDDLLVVAKVADRAHSYIFEEQSKERKEENGKGSKDE